MNMEVEELEEVEEVLRDLGEEKLLRTLKGFESIWGELKTKNGEDYARLAMLSFMEGMLASLKRENRDPRVERLYERVKGRRAELDELFRKPKMRNLQ